MVTENYEINKECTDVAVSHTHKILFCVCTRDRMSAIRKLDLEAYTWDSFVGPCMTLSDLPYLNCLQWVLLLRHITCGLGVKSTDQRHIRHVLDVRGTDPRLSI